MDDLNPLMAKLSNKVMLSQILKLVQVYIDYIDCFFFFVLFLLM